MAIKVYISCDAPDCKRQIDLDIHANTWFKLIYTLYKIDGQCEDIVHNLCSYYCIVMFANSQSRDAHKFP